MINNFLDTQGLSAGDRVVIAMSGGVDSSAAAALAKAAGLDVVGITLQLYDHGKMIDKKGACCAGRDITDAKNVAAVIGFPHYVLDYETQFRRAVMDNFADSYLQGQTPVPCVQCNQKVKFTDMLQTAKDLGAKALITGHYVQRIVGNHGPELHRAVDAKRDQSYFLFATTPEQLEFCRFPLGGIPTKEITRQIAAQYNLPVAKKPDSQDICFVVDGDYRQVVKKLRPNAQQSGQIIHLDGTILGTHKGIMHFTVGQRRGINVTWPEPLYVISIDAVNQRIIVGPQAVLARSTLEIKNVSWVNQHHSTQSILHAQVKIRSTQSPISCQIEQTAMGAQIHLDYPEYGVSSGQACVFYQDTEVLGGGWIV